MTNHANAPVSGIKTNYVYFLFDPTMNLAKIGHSTTPGSRISHLSNCHPGIDLSRSVLLEADTRALEFVLHAVFSESRRSLSVYADGHTEWFDAAVFDEALNFAKYVGKVRGKDYRITQDLTTLVEAHRRDSAAKWVRGATASAAPERLTPAASMALLAELAAERAEHCLEILSERDLDGLVTDGSRWAIERTTQRDREPELWTTARFSTDQWSSRLWAASKVAVSDSFDYGRIFNGFTGVTLLRHGDTASEFIHLPEGWRRHAENGDDEAKRNFFAPLVMALSELPLRVIDPGTGPFEMSSSTH